MRPWNEIIAEAKNEKNMTAAEINKAGAATLKEIQTKNKSKKEPYGPGNPSFDLAKKREKRKNKQLKFSIDQSRKNAEKKKKQELENIKNKPKQVANAALSGIKTQSISHRDSDATAYTKALGNAASLAGGVVKAGIGYGIARHQAKKEAAEAEKSDGASKIPKKKPKKSGPLGGRPPGSRPTAPAGGSTAPAGGSTAPAGGSTAPTGGSTAPTGGLGVKPRKRLVPSTKRLPPAGGGKSLGQQARENPELRKKLINQRNEEYSNWREEFIFEVEDKTDKPNKKKEKKKIIDVMSGENKIEINPNMKEEKDQEGGMAHNELATMERAVKTLRKKIKSPNQQLPAWVQSKISKAADHIDTVADYMSGETEPVSEGYDDGNFRQHSQGTLDTSSTPTPSERRNRTAGVLKLMKQVNADVEKPKKKKKKKTVAEDCGCEDDKKKVLAREIIKKVVDTKKKNNSQLNSGIIGESSPAWQRKEGKNQEGGLNKAGIASYRKENPGSKLSLAVTTPPSKLDPDSKSAKRRKSFCARMGGMPGPMKDEKGRPTRKALSLRKWNC